MRKVYLFVILLLSSYLLQAQVAAPLCSGATSLTYTNTDFGDAGGTLYTWGAPSVPGISGTTGGIGQTVFTAQTLTNSTTSPIVVVYTLGMITPPFTRTITITVNPTPTVNAIANPAATCTGTLTPLVTFSGAVASTTYNWTNAIPAVGLAALGSGDIAPFTATNLTSLQVFATIVVTPVSNTCSGTSQTFTYTINPTPTLNLTLDQVLCTGVATTAATFTSTVASTVFNWTNNTPGIGLLGTGVGNIASFTTTNISNVPITGYIQVTPVSNTCNGVAQTFSITVKPLPTVNVTAPQTVCNGVLTTAVNFTGAVANTTYNWTNSSSTIGLAFPTGSGNIAAFTASNPSNIPVSAIITITPASNSCNGTPLQFSITVNPTPDITGGITDVVFCNGVATTTVTFSSSVANADYAWTSNATSIGIAAAGSTTITSFTAANPTSAATTALITVAPLSNTCVGAPRTFSITVNPTPGITSGIVDQIVCNGTLTNIVNFTGSVTGTTFSWVNNTTSIGLATPGTGTINPFAAANSSTTPIVATITVLPISNTCIGTPQSFSITVNPTPIVNIIADQVVCNTGSSVLIPLIGSVTGAVYTWSNTNSGVGLGASGIGDILPFSGTNITNIPTTAQVVVTPMSNTCYGATTSFTVTINPTPTVNIIADQVHCNNTLTALVNITGSVTGTVYNWINDNGTIGLLGTGAGNISAFTTINASNAPVFGNITVTPTANTCQGSPYTFSITVNPTPVAFTIPAQAICNGFSTTTISLTGSVTSAIYNWTNNTPSIGLGAASLGDINPFTATNATNAVVTAIITVTPFSNSCNGAPVSFTITVNPTPTLVAISDQIVCNGFSTAANFTGSVTGTIFNWTNSNFSIGLATSGSGNIGAFSLTNVSNGPITGILVVTPTANACSGIAQTFSITVNPTPTVVAVGDQVICNGFTSTLVTFTGYVPSTTYNWTNNNGAIGIATSSSGNIASFTGINGTTVPITGLITVTPVSNACAGTPISFSYTINPTPGINIVSNLSVCNGGLAFVAFSGSVITNTVYNWTNGNATIGLTSTGSGSSISFTSSNLSNAPVAAALTVTPMSNSCNGITQSFSIVVNPTPTVSIIGDQFICNGTLTSLVTFAGNIPTAVYSWTNTNTAVGAIAASATSTSITAFTGTNAGTLPISALITVTPVSNACTGTSTVFSITINPTPVVTAMSNTAACNGVLTAFTFTGSSVGNTNYSWTNDNISVGIGASGSGNITTFTALNTGTLPVYASIIVTPISNTCGGISQGFSFVVNPTPTVTPSITTQVLCNGLTSTAVNFSGLVPSTVYNWTNTNTNIGITASAVSNIASFTATNTVLIPISGMITVTPMSNSCNGSPVSFTITVNPTPTVNALSNTSICNGVLTSFTFTGSAIANTTYNWTNTNTQVNIAASGIGNITSFTATNLVSPAPITAILTVTPLSNACSGTPQSFTLTVNPTPTVNAVGGPFISCAGSITTAITFTGTVAFTNYNWTNTNAATGLTSLSSTGNIAAFTTTNALAVPINSSVIVTPVSNTCAGTPIAFSFIVNPIPTVVAIGDQNICNTFSTTAVTFTGFVAGTTYNWTSTNAAVGFASLSGTGNISAFAGTNAGSLPISTLIQVTPVSNACNGTLISFSIIVNPTPSVNSIAGAPFVLCTGGVTSAITFTGNVPFTSYNWTNTNSATGLLSFSSTGNIAAFTTTNTLAIPISSSVTVTPISNACSGTPIAFSYIVNPVPTVNIIGNQSICNTFTTTTVTFTGFVANTTYNWTNTNVGLGLAAASGSGTINSFIGTNPGSVPTSTSITVTPFSNTCTGVAHSFSIVVNPTPTVNTITSQAICNGSLTSAVTFTGAVSPAIYQWSHTNTGTGLNPLSSTGNIAAFTATNGTGLPISTLVTVVPFSNNCSGAPVSFTLVVNPVPTVSAITNQAICNNFSSTAVTFSGLVPGTTYQWANTNTAVGLTSFSGTGNIASFLATNAGTVPISTQITVLPISACTGTSLVFTITVNPTPLLSSTLTPSAICNGATFSYTAASLTPGSTFLWTRGANTNINGNTTGSGTSTINEQLSNNSPVTAVNAIYAFTLTANSCTNTQFVTVAINPSAVLTSGLTPTAICALTTFSYIASSSAPGATLTWTRTLPAGLTSGGAASGIGNISQSIDNTTTAPQIASYAYAVAVSGCTNPNAFTVTFNVNPIPALSSSVAPSPICSGTSFAYLATSATVGTTFSWSKPAVSGIATTAPLTGNINPIFHVFSNNNTTLTNVTYIYTLNANGCVNGQTVTTGVYPVGSLNSTLAPNPVCSNTIFSYSPTSTTGGITFNWSRSPVSGIINPAGSGVNDPYETLINTTALPVNVTYIYNTLTAAGCTNAQTVVVTINPTPTLTSSLTPAAICTGNVFNYAPTSGTPSTIFNWSRPVVTGITNGAGTGFNNPAESLANPTINPVAAVYNFTLTANTCTNNQAVTVFVNPIPIVGSQSATICSNTIFTITPTNVPAATLYTWGAPTVTPVGSTLGANLQSTGITSISQFLNNQTVSATTVVYTVLPTATGCNGNTFTVTVTVNPTPVVGAQTMTAVCSGTPFNFVATGIPTGTSYTWSAPTAVPSNSLTGGTAQPLTQPSVSQTLVSTNNLMDTAIYSVTPATVLCIGNPFLLSVPVKPVPVISNLRDTICSGNTFVLNPTPIPANTTFTWTAPAVSPSGTITGGSAQTVPTTGISQTLTNNSTAYAQATYTVTPSALNCAGTPFLLIETVNRTIPVFAAQNALICSGTAFNATPNNTPAGTTFTWPVPANTPPVGITGTSASLFPVTLISQVLSNNNNAIDTAIYTVTPSINNCPGVSFLASIRVMPLPKATISGPASVCANVLVDTVSLAFNGTAPWTFTFSDGITTNTRTGITSSPYKLTLPAMAKNISKRVITVMNVKDATCSNTIDSSFFTQTINPLPVGKIISLHGNYLCNGIKDTLFVQSADSLGYQWKLNTVNIAGATTDSIATTSAGSYNAMLTNVFGCSDSAAVPATLYLIKPPVLKLSVDTSCINSITTFKNLTDTTFTGAVQWFWNFGNSKTSTAMDGVTTYSIAGNYHVSLKATQLNCIAYPPVTLDTTINIQFPIPGVVLPSVSASKGVPTPVDSRSIPGYTYQWTPSAGIQNPDSPSTVFNASATQQYIIKLISKAGCVTNDSLLVRVFDADVKEIFVPKTFTPNGDGVNDKLYPYIAGVKQFHYFRILNRFGKLLFETKTPDTGWDGTLNGVQQPMSIYFWFAEGVLEDGTVVQKSGQVLLIR